MNQNPLARLFGLTKKEFSISLSLGGLIVFTALLYEGYVLYKSGQVAPGAVRTTIPTASPAQTPTASSRLAVPSLAATGMRSLPTLVSGAGRPIIGGGVIAGPATAGAFMAGAATARQITAPLGQVGVPATSPGSTATVSPGQTLASTSAEPAPIATFLDPVPVGTGFSLPGLGTLTVNRTSWQPGEIGLAIVDISFICELPTGERCDSSSLLLTALGNSGNSYARAFDPAIPEPAFGSLARPHLSSGQTDRGNAGFFITNVEGSLRLRVRIFLEDGEYFFWLAGK